MRARLGNLWVIPRSDLRLRKKAKELPTRGVQRALVIFPAIVNERTAV